MLSERVGVGSQREYSEIGPTVLQIHQLLRRQHAQPIGVRFQVYKKVVFITREQQRKLDASVWAIEAQRWGRVSWHNLKLGIYKNMIRETLTDVLERQEPRVYGLRFFDRFRENSVPETQPRTLIDLEVMPQIPPLLIRNQGIRYASENAATLKYAPFMTYYPNERGAPPFGWIVMSVVSFCGLQWGWVRARSDDLMAGIAVLVFLGSAVMLFWCGFSILPWLATF